MISAKLHFDQRFDPRIGNNATLDCWIENDGDEGFTEVKVTVREPSPSGSLEFSQFHRRKLVPPGAPAECHVNIKASAAGSYKIEILVFLTGTNDVVTALKTSKFLKFKVLEKSDGEIPQTVIEIDSDGASLIDKVPSGAMVRIKGDYATAITFADSAKEKYDGLANAQAGPPESENLFPLSLVEDVPGLAPLDLQQFASSWHGSKKRKLSSFKFVDRHKQPHEPLEAPTAHSGTPYQLQIGSNACGHVTLVIQGAPNDQYYIALPNSDCPNPYLEFSQELIFPSRALRAGPVNPNNASQEFTLKFGSRGVEKALVIVTKEPLVTDIKPLFPDTAATGKFAADESNQAAIKQILTQAWEASRKDPAAAELLYTQVTVI